MNSKPMTVPGLIRNIVPYLHPATHPFLAYKDGDIWVDITYQEALLKIDAISYWFLHRGVVPGERLALIIENGPDYIYFDQALQQVGAVNTSIYPTLNEKDIIYILNDSGARMILVGNPYLFKKILKIAKDCPFLGTIIPTFDDYKKYIQSPVVNVSILSLAEVMQAGLALEEIYGSRLQAVRDNVQPEDLSGIIYTSGTTGVPKGVMLTHLNFTSNVWACLTQITEVDKDDVFLSFLPLSHVFERTATYHICLAVGCKIAFAQSLDLLAKNMVEIGPTIMNCVPRLLERIHNKAIESGTSGNVLKMAVFKWALKTGRRFREKNEQGTQAGIVLRLQQKIAERLVFSKLKEKTGGRLKFMISGGGALPKNVGEFFGNMGIKILEGFGLTETSAVMSVTEQNRQVYGTAGRIIPGIRVGIQALDTKNIFAIQTHESFHPSFESPEGEIIVSGHCVMKGYFNQPEQTAAAIDKDGWFHTGDIGRFHQGNLQITDRLKNMLVNAYGKNIYPTPVENIYLKSPKIEAVFLIGDKREFITALIVPAKELMKESFKLDDSFFEVDEEFIDDPEIVRWIAKDIQLYAESLAKFERIKGFRVKRKAFAMELDEITPTMKIKRKVVERKYASVINELYR